jgi:hypothetical protein
MDPVRQFYYDHTTLRTPDFYARHHRATTVAIDADLGRHEQLFRVLGERQRFVSKHGSVLLPPERESLVAHLSDQLNHSPSLPTKWEPLALASRPDFPPELISKLFSFFNNLC